MSGGWQCQLCTYINEDPHAQRCGMCDAPRSEARAVQKKASSESLPPETIATSLEEARKDNCVRYKWVTKSGREGSSELSLSHSTKESSKFKLTIFMKFSASDARMERVLSRYHTLAAEFVPTLLKAVTVMQNRARAVKLKNKGGLARGSLVAGEGLPSNPISLDKVLKVRETGNLQSTEIEDGALRLEERCRELGVRMDVMEDDGNCQFRAFARQLFGSQEHHLLVRHRAVNWMWTHRADYSVFFDGDAEFVEYLERMAIDRTWGDELTLRAVADCYGVKVHVVTSQRDNFYLLYEPAQERLREGRRQLFVAYIAPVHYNTLHDAQVDLPVAALPKARPTRSQDTSQGMPKHVPMPSDRAAGRPSR